MIVKMLGEFSLEYFSENLDNSCINLWYSKKGHRIHQNKRKTYTKSDVSSKKQKNWDETLTSDSSDYATN